IFEPRKLRPFSIEFCNAPIAVITEMTEKTPIVMPSMVSAERNLFAPNELQAILMISRNNIVDLDHHFTAEDTENAEKIIKQVVQLTRGRGVGFRISAAER